MGSYRRALWVVGFILIRRVHFGSFGRPLGVVGFRYACFWAHSRAAWGSSGSFGSLGSFGQVQGYVAGTPWVLLGSFRRVLGVIGFIRVRWVHTGAPLGSFGFYGSIRARRDGRWVHLGAPWWSSGSFWFFRARCSVHSG